MMRGLIWVEMVQAELLTPDWHDKLRGLIYRSLPCWMRAEAGRERKKKHLGRVRFRVTMTRPAIVKMMGDL